MNRMSARNRLLFLLATILICSFLGISFLNYKVTRASVHAEILGNDLPLTMDNIYSELSSELTKPLLVASSMASDTFLKDWAMEGELDSDRIVRYLDEIKEKYGFFSTFFVSATSGIYYRYNGIHKTVSPDDGHDVWFFDFLSSDREYEYDVDNDEAASNILTIFINYKIFDTKGMVLGVAGVGLQVDSVADRIIEYQKKYDRAVYLTDIRGVVQVHSDTALIEKKRIADLEGMAPLAEKILEKTKEPKSFEFDRDDHRILLTVRYIQALNWFLYVEQNETNALLIARKNFIRTLLVGLVVSGIIIGLALVTINRYQERLEALAVTDELTGTANRRVLGLEFKRTLSSYLRSGRLFSLILLDLDGFKRVNDTLGHIVGDLLLIEIVDLMGKSIRPTDVLVRWGGDEFVILAESGEGDVLQVAERIRRGFETAKFGGPTAELDDPRNLVTVSSGISVYCDGDSLDSMIYRADQAMYRCKARGGNCVELGA